LKNVGGVHGLPEEHEDIRIDCFPCDDAFRAVTEGRINNAATVIALQWLQLQRKQTSSCAT
jgi:ADP-ribose pyrophosphatase